MLFGTAKAISISSPSEILSDAKQLNEQEKRQVDDAFGRTTTRERGLKL